MPTEVTKEALSEIFAAVKQNPRGRDAERDLRRLFLEAEVGDAVTVSSCSGGTRQIHNRLGQAEVQNATDMTFLVLQPEDGVDGLVEYIAAAFRNERPVHVPAGPVAIAQEDENGQWTVKGIVAKPRTQAVRVLEELYDLQAEDPYADITAQLPEGVSLATISLDVSAGELEDRFQFDPDSSEGERVQPGSVVLLTEEDEAGDRVIVGIGQVGRVVQTGPEGGPAIAVLSRLEKVRPPIAENEVA